MSCINSFGNINETFVIEPLLVIDDTLTACTGVYTNQIYSCSGDTSISLGSGLIIINGSVSASDITANTINASTYLSGGTNLLDIFTSVSVKLTGGTYDSINKTLTLKNNDGSDVNVTGFTDYYTTGVTYNNNTFVFTTNNGYTYSATFNTLTGLTINGDLTVTGNTFLNALTANTISASTYQNLPLDIYTTAATLFNNTVYFDRNDQLSAYTLNLSSFTTNDFFVTGGTYNASAHTLTLTRNDGSDVNVTGFTDYFITGGTYSAGTITFTNSNGETFQVSGLSTSNATQFTGGTVSGATEFTNGLSANTLSVTGNTTLNGLTATTISAATYQNLPIDPDTYVTGLTFDQITYVLKLDQNTNNPSLSSFTANLAILASDVTITGGTYNPVTGIASFTNNSGGTFNVSGFTTGITDTVITGYTYTPSANTFTIRQSNGNTFTSNFNTVSGLTVNGALTVTGVTTTPSMTSGFLGGNMYGTWGISQGGSLSISTGSALLQNFITLTHVATLPYNQYALALDEGNGFYIRNLNAGTIDLAMVSGRTGLGTVLPTNRLHVSASTDPVRFQGITGASDSKVLTIDSNGVVHSIDAFALVTSPFTGGTVSGATQFTNGLTANTISATTYQGLPVDVRVTGGTLSAGTVTFSNNTGGTFNVTGFTYLKWYAENATGPTIAPVATGSGSVVFGDNAKGLATGMFVYGYEAGFAAIGASYSNFIGYQAGYNSPNAAYSNFIGFQAGSGATNAQNSNFIGNSAGYRSTNAQYSNFIGLGAGTSATNAEYSNFFGFSAGVSATNGNNSNFLGQSAGQFASNATQSNFLGLNAGYQAINASGSTFLGPYAGFNATNASNSNFIGNAAGSVASSANKSNFIGFGAGLGATNAYNSNFIGENAGVRAVNANNSNFLGSFAGRDASGASYSTLIGYSTGLNFTNNNIGSNNIIIGTNISLPNGANNSINIGGVLFGTGTYSTTTGNPSITPSNGSIGINVVSSAITNTLHVSAATNPVRFEGLQSSTNIRFIVSDSNGVLSYRTDVPLTGSTGSSATTIYNGNGSLNGNRIVDIDGFTLNFSGSTALNNLVLSGGNVGIGTASPTYKLDVNGNFRVNGSITNESLGVYSNLPIGTAMVIGTISNSGHTAIFTKPNSSGSTAIRITDQNINGNQWFFIDYTGSAGFGFSSGNVVNDSAQVEIQSTTKGFLGPRMTEAQRLAISSPATGLIVYQTNNDEGYYIYKSFGWVQII